MDEASYTCSSCGEEIVIPIDRTAGATQEYVEDCPVCCHANVIQVKIENDDDASVLVKAELESWGPNVPANTKTVGGSLLIERRN